ncbi:MAG: recombination and strand exchange inhibitor protein [Sphingobacteriaceae bacterium]|jgi:DNA-nicking Smr family endonuclease|nr:recombination and strand exchange inhibitor protein [Sphingobacteriaceae bacterium]
MKFKLGDFVRFVDERREGYITRIIDEQMVGVTGDDDFEIPVPINKITLVHGQLERSGNGDDAPVPIPVTSGSFKESGVFLGVTNDPRIASVAHFHLINTSSYQLHAVLNTEKAGSQKGEYAGTIAPESSAKIYSASLNELSSWPTISLQILYFSNTSHKPKKPLTYSEKFKAKDFSGAKKNAPLINQAAWLFPLDDEEITIDPQQLKESFFKSVEEKTGIPRPATEIDLHIEKLSDSHQFLTSSEILTAQLNEFKKNLEAAIVHKLSSIIFIHGTGNGTLRHEVHKIVSKHPGVKTFSDARKEKFGYGATEVWLK